MQTATSGMRTTIQGQKQRQVRPFVFRQLENLPPIPPPARRQARAPPLLVHLQARPWATSIQQPLSGYQRPEPSPRAPEKRSKASLSPGVVAGLLPHESSVGFSFHVGP